MLSSLFPRLAAYRDSSVGRFWWLVTGERIAVTLLVAVALHFANVPDENSLADWRLPQLLVVALVVSPLLETLALQALPCEVARNFSAGYTTRLSLAWLPFAALHLTAGLGTFLCAGVVSGYYLAGGFVRLREVSFPVAFWLTAASHALLNGISVGIDFWSR